MGYTDARGSKSALIRGVSVSSVANSGSEILFFYHHFGVEAAFLLQPSSTR